MLKSIDDALLTLTTLARELSTANTDETALASALVSLREAYEFIVNDVTTRIARDRNRELDNDNANINDDKILEYIKSASTTYDFDDYDNTAYSVGHSIANDAEEDLLTAYFNNVSNQLHAQNTIRPPANAINVCAGRDNEHANARVDTPVDIIKPLNLPPPMFTREKDYKIAPSPAIARLQSRSMGAKKRAVSGPCAGQPVPSRMQEIAAEEARNAYNQPRVNADAIAIMYNGSLQRQADYMQEYNDLLSAAYH